MLFVFLVGVIIGYEIFLCGFPLIFVVDFIGKSINASPRVFLISNMSMLSSTLDRFSIKELWSADGFYLVLFCMVLVIVTSSIWAVVMDSIMLVFGSVD